MKSVIVNPKQRAEVVEILLAMSGLGRQAMSREGRIRHAAELRIAVKERPPLPRGWWVLVELARWIDGDASDAHLHALGSLPPESMECVGDLLMAIAIGRDDLNGWITDHRSASRAA